ncbi:MAG TPA: hypothetical protein VJ841_01330 [Candidatus Saccharimonadales bacterium]|nr:hypothetical protein [Candidatus Saccharimonadales bacterium]
MIRNEIPFGVTPVDVATPIYDGIPDARSFAYFTDEYTGVAVSAETLAPSATIRYFARRADSRKCSGLNRCDRRPLKSRDRLSSRRCPRRDEHDERRQQARDSEHDWRTCELVLTHRWLSPPF